MPTWVKGNDAHTIDIEEKNTNDIFGGGGSAGSAGSGSGLPSVTKDDIGKTLIVKGVPKNVVYRDTVGTNTNDWVVIADTVPDWFVEYADIYVETGDEILHGSVQADGEVLQVWFYFLGKAVILSTTDENSLALYFSCWDQEECDIIIYAGELSPVWGGSIHTAGMTW